jgi:LacI family transcriptional regulator
MATIYDVAAMAGVAVKTVSRAINHHPNVSLKTRAKVQQAIAELDYVPSPIARQMRTGESTAIGMLYGDPSSGYQSQLNHAMLKACSNARLYMAVELFDESDSDWTAQVDRFIQRTKVASMVLVPPICDSADVHALLREQGIRSVLISPSQPVPGCNAVCMDDRAAAKQVTRHLIKLGHQRIAHIAGRENHVVTLLRRLGFEDAAVSGGLEPGRTALVREGRFNFKEAMDCTKELLLLPERPTAIFAANDHMAIAAIMMARQMGLRVPEDISVAGFDDTWIGQSIWPSLTTVAQPLEAIATMAVELLQDRSTQAETLSTNHVLPHEFIVRGSTAPPPE